MTKEILDSSKYSFNPTAQQITFADKQIIEHILIITNVTDNVIIYNFGCEGFGGDLDSSNKVLTLDYDTTAMNALDNLQVIVYSSVQGDTVAQAILTLIRQQNNAQNEILEELQKQTKLLKKIYNPE
jgi:hypothetical protein